MIYVEFREPYHFQFLFGNLTYQMMTMMKKNVLTLINK